jgi:hypothetical protein
MTSRGLRALGGRKLHFGDMPRGLSARCVSVLWQGNIMDDRDILIDALENAARAYREQSPPPSLLSGPDSTVIDPLSAAIRRCAAFQSVAGHVLFSGGSGPVIDAPALASKLFSGRERWNGERREQDIPSAVDWLLRLLATREAPGIFKAVIWGISIDEEVSLVDSSRLMPFSALPDSYMKGRISERAKPCYNNSVWVSHTYFDVPQAAFLKEVPNFPYIRTDFASFDVIKQLEMEARDFWVLIQAAAVGNPLVIGCWFEYADRELEFAEWENTLGWILPEIPPHVARCTPADLNVIQANLRNYIAFPTNLQSALLRSMKRFVLSQCRHGMIDRVLDLALVTCN